MGFDPTQNLRVLPLEGARNWCPQELSVRQLFSHVLDIFGKPNRKFFETLSFFAKELRVSWQMIFFEVVFLEMLNKNNMT